MVYTNLKDSPRTLHGLFESSRLTATDTGRIYDALVVKDMTDKEAIDVDNGVAVKIHDFTGDGLQEVYATVATTKDKIAVVGAPAHPRKHIRFGLRMMIFLVLRAISLLLQALRM